MLTSVKQTEVAFWVSQLYNVKTGTKWKQRFSFNIRYTNYIYT